MSITSRNDCVAIEFDYLKIRLFATPVRMATYNYALPTELSPQLRPAVRLAVLTTGMQLLQFTIRPVAPMVVLQLNGSSSELRQLYC